MNDKLDFNLLEKNATKYLFDSEGKELHYYWLFNENGIETKISGNKKQGFYMRQTPPPPAFFKYYKEYYPNGNLKVKGKSMGGGATRVGKWEYYNENGELTSVKNEEKKFGKFGYNELLFFLHQQGHINIETGENRENAEFGYNSETKRWGVHVFGKHIFTEYVIDGKSGEIIKKEENEITM